MNRDQRIAAERIGIAAAVTQPLPRLPAECEQLWQLLPKSMMVGQGTVGIIRSYEAMLWVKPSVPGPINERIMRCAKFYKDVREGRL